MGKATKQPRIEIYKGNTGSWYWRLRAKNGKVIADGSEGYSSRATVKRAVAKMLESVAAFNASGASPVEVDY